MEHCQDFLHLASMKNSTNGPGDSWSYHQILIDSFITILVGDINISSFPSFSLSIFFSSSSFPSFFLLRKLMLVSDVSIHLHKRGAVNPIISEETNLSPSIERPKRPSRP